MGLYGSKDETKHSDKHMNNNTLSSFDPTQSPPELSEKEKCKLRDSWEAVKKDVSRVGVITFLSLFETHPEVHDAFMSFRAMSTTELEYNHILRKHALRVMGTVDKCIYRLDNRDKIQELMTDLGIRHKSYAMKIHYVDLMGPQFIASIKEHFEDKWTQELESAWQNLFNYMNHYMKKGMCSI